MSEKAPMTPDEARVQSARDYEEWDKYGKRRKEYSTEEKATLWDAHENYQGNKESYQQAAIEDANAAGHDIRFGGENYPSQGSVEPGPRQTQ